MLVKIMLPDSLTFKQIRGFLNCTLAEVSEGTGISTQTISSIENDIESCRFRNVKTLSVFYNGKLAELEKND